MNQDFSHVDFSQFRSIAEIISDLSKPVKVAPRQGNTIGHLEVRKQGGADILYISWSRAAQYLDYYAPGWFKEIVRIDAIAGKLILTVRLYIPAKEGMFWRESTGQEDETTKSYGDSSSNSESMAFRRAAAQFGLCRYLYEISDRERAQILSGNQIEVKTPQPKGFEHVFKPAANAVQPEAVKTAQTPQEAQSEPVPHDEAEAVSMLESLMNDDDAEIDPFSERKPNQAQAALDALIGKAEENGFSQADIVTAARIYCQQNNIQALTAEQIADIDARMTARIEKEKGQVQETTPEAEAPKMKKALKPTGSQLESIEYLAQKNRVSEIDICKQFGGNSVLVFKDLTRDQADEAITYLNNKVLDKATT